MVTPKMKLAVVLTGDAGKTYRPLRTNRWASSRYVDNVMVCILRYTASLGFWIRIPHFEDFRQQYQTIGTTTNYAAQLSVYGRTAVKLFA
jgi:hypothetical protein